MMEGMLVALLGMLGIVVMVSLIALIHMCLGAPYSDENQKRPKSSSSKKLTMPGPRGLPIIGSLLDFDVRFNHISLAKFAKQYGGLCQVKLGSQKWVVSAKYDYVREALITKGRALGGRNRTYRLQYLMEGAGIFARDPTYSDWQVAKNFVIKHMGHLGNGQSKLDGVLANLLEELMTEMKSHDGNAVDMRKPLDNFMDCTMYAVFTGNASLTSDDESLVLFKTLLRAVLTFLGIDGAIELDMIPWLRHIERKNYKTMKDIVALKQRVWRRLWSDAHRDKAAGDQQADPTSMLQAMCDISNPESPNYNGAISLDTLEGFLLDFVFGGVSTISGLCYELLNILLHYPTVLSRLQDEVDSVTGKSSRRPTVADQDKMPYTMAVVYELARYVTIVPVLAHRALEESKLGEYSIPVGTTVMVNIWAMHHDEEFWGDPWSFRPERFIDENSQLLPLDHPNRTHLMALGSGTRYCMGEVFAWRRLFLYTAYIAQSFNLWPSESGLTSCDCRTFPTSLIIEPTTFHVKLLERIPNSQ